MEEKEFGLTVEEIVKAHETCETRKGCVGCPYTEKGINCNIKDDMQRLQDEKVKLRKLVEEFEILKQELAKEIQRLQNLCEIRKEIIETQDELLKLKERRNDNGR